MVADLDWWFYPLHRWIWSDAHRRGRKLLRFGETEADGARDLARASELTSDPRLRRLYLRHAEDEQRHADMFLHRAITVLLSLSPRTDSSLEANWLAPGERGLDDLRVDGERDDTLLAFLHLSECAAAGRFKTYQKVLTSDPKTQQLFSDILRDEEFHMNYTKRELVRISPKKHGWSLFSARAHRLWKAYLRLATALAGVLGGLLLVVQYFIVLPLFALLAKRAAQREPEGWVLRRQKHPSLASQYE
ncbi:MAG: ferritin-like domain-containing protein [Polyangiaceae bacterium]